MKIWTTYQLNFFSLGTHLKLQHFEIHTHTHTHTHDDERKVNNRPCKLLRLWLILHNVVVLKTFVECISIKFHVNNIFQSLERKKKETKYLQEENKFHLRT